MKLQLWWEFQAANLHVHVQSLSLKFSQEIRFLQYTHFEGMAWKVRETVVKHPLTTSPICWASVQAAGSRSGKGGGGGGSVISHKHHGISNRRRLDHFYNDLVNYSSFAKLVLYEGNPLLIGGFPHKGPRVWNVYLCHDAITIWC